MGTLDNMHLLMKQGWKPHPHRVCLVKYDGREYLRLEAEALIAGDPAVIMTPEEVESWKALENSQATPKSST